MNDDTAIVLLVKTALAAVAQQASALAIGLQNAAPGEKKEPNQSVQYLLDISGQLQKKAEECQIVLSEK